MIEGLQVRVPAEVVGEFSSSGLIFRVLLIQCPFHPVLLQWHIKDLDHSAKSAGGRLHLNVYTPLTQRSWNGLTVLSRHSLGTYQRNELKCNSSGNTQPQLSQLAEPLWTDSGLKCCIGVHKLIST